MTPPVANLKRPVSAICAKSSIPLFPVFFPLNFLALLLELGAVDGVMFSVDHPFASTSQARAFWNQLPVSAADRSGSHVATRRSPWRAIET
jgi:hypothetical protein